MSSSQHPLQTPVSRRRALALGGGLAAGGLVSVAAPEVARADASGTITVQHGRLPVARIQQILHAEGTVSKGVLGSRSPATTSATWSARWASGSPRRSRSTAR